MSLKRKRNLNRNSKIISKKITKIISKRKSINQISNKEESLITIINRISNREIITINKEGFRIKETFRKKEISKTKETSTRIKISKIKEDSREIKISEND